MTRDEAIERLKNMAWLYGSNEREQNIEAIDMAISALSKPNYETDTEVRLVVTDRHKDKVVLCDVFGEVEYLPVNKTISALSTETDTLTATNVEKVQNCGTQNIEKVQNYDKCTDSNHAKVPTDLMSHEEAWEQIENGKTERREP